MRHKIEITGLRVFGHHGVLDFERQQGQHFVIDAKLWLQLDPKKLADDISGTVHYGELSQVIAGIVAGEPVDLIETLATRLLTAVIDFSPIIEKAQITVHKPAAPVNLEFSDISVTVRAKRGELS